MGKRGRVEKQGDEIAGSEEEIMNTEELKEYLLAKTGTTEEVPFGPGVWVYKVMGKVFALLPWDAQPLNISLKCDPILAQELRSVYPAVTGGYHLNKKHWNTVQIDGTIPLAEIQQMIDHSYELVVKGLPRALRQQLG